MVGGEVVYQTMIRECAARLGRVGVDPRHVETWMRVEHATLDALSPRQFEDEVAAAIACVDTAGTDASERLAESFGL